MQLRTRGRRVSLIPPATPGAARATGALCSWDADALLAGADLPPAVRSQLAPSDLAAAASAITAWRAERREAARRALVTRAADALRELASALGDPAAAPRPSGLLAALESHRLRTLIDAHHELGETLRAHAEHLGLLYSVPAAADLSAATDEDPVIIASDHSDTVTVSQWDVARIAKR
jgi:hypothetical protein